MGVLDGRVAVIIGGSRGTGLAIASRFVAEGAYVFITGRDPRRLRRATHTIGRLVTSVVVNPSDPEDLDFLYSEIREIVGHLDIVVSASAAHPTSPIPQMSPDAFAALDAAEAGARYQAVRAALPVLRRSGAAAVLVGAGAYIGADQRAHGTLLGVADAWSAELAERRTRIGVISAPGADLWEPAGTDAVDTPVIDDPAPFAAELSERIASAAALLASHTASYLASAEVAIAANPSLTGRR